MLTLNRPSPRPSEEVKPPAPDAAIPSRSARARLRESAEWSQAILRKVWQQVFVDVNRDARSATYLAGDGRSGTTWVSDIINHGNSHRFVFEPFHPAFVPLAKDFRFFQYLRPEEKNEGFFDPVQRVVTGAYRYPWIDRFNKKTFCTRRLVKDIFSNLFLKWLHVRFPGMPLVLVVRHPCAVASSKKALKEWVWKVNPRGFLDQPKLMADHLEPFRGLIEDTTDEYGKQILHWCLTHYVPLRQFRRGEIHIVAYEHLCIRREEEIRCLLDYLGQPYDPAVLLASRKPSVTVSEERAANWRPDNLISGWCQTIRPEQRRRAAEILAAFDLGLYADDPLPLCDDPASCLRGTDG